jgi:hypothetical protein
MLKLLNDCIYFEVVVGCLAHALDRLGVTYCVVPRVAEEDYSGPGENVYILCTTHHLQARLPVRYISYNFEQLVTDKAWPDEFFERLRGADQVWDYSLENIRVLEAQGVPGAAHVPFGYSRCMDAAGAGGAPWGSRGVDWAFVGSVNEGRRAKLSSLSARSELRGVVTNSCWGRDLEAAYATTRVGVNLHYYDGRTILEVHRIIPMVANRVLVVSERSDDAWYDRALRGVVTFLPESARSPAAAVAGPLATAVAVAARVLSGDKAEEELDRRRAELVRRLSFDDMFAAAVADGRVSVPGAVRR